ncbi:MAG TPA: AraC family transcriptional regulator [Polyangiales bacterium]|nr:AraC family transcriptional regulator [Polyangiales bacterium]
MSPEITGPVLPLLFEQLRSAGGIEQGSGVAWSGSALPLSDFVRTLERAAAHSGKRGLLWRCGQTLARESLDTLIPATRGVRSLGHALPLAVASMGLAQTASSFELRQWADHVTFEYRVLEPAIWPRARDAELTLGFLDGLVRRFAPADFQPLSVTFEHAKDAHSSAFTRALFRHPTNSYSLPRALLAGTSQPTAATALSALQRELAEREQGADLCERMRRAVFALIGSDEPVDLGRVAARCTLSTRSLRRHLAAHGLSFRRELQRLRLEYARCALMHTDLPIDEIARRLGYSEQSALTRAVRRELGASPSQLRERLRRAASSLD